MNPTQREPRRFQTFSLVLATLIGGWPGGPAAAQLYGFTAFSVEDGLPQSQVTAVLQDRRGYLWAGTYGGGLSRFDGLEFRNYTTADGLAGDTVRALLEDRRGRLWIGNDGGLTRYDGQGFEVFTLEDGLPDLHVRALYEDPTGRLWVGTEAGIVTLDGAALSATLPDFGRVAVRSIFSDTGGRLWVGTTQGLRLFDSAGLKEMPLPPGLPATEVSSIAEDRRGSLWFGTAQGAWRLAGGRWTAVDGESAPRGPVTAILEDQAGRMWLATENNGVYRGDGTRFVRYTEKEGLPSNTVWALIEDREGQKWFGTYRGGLARFDGEAFVHFTAETGLGDDVVRTILEDRRGRLVFGTYRGGVTLYDGRTFTQLTEKDGLVDNFVLSALEDRRGDLWFGAFSGLTRYDGNRFESFALALPGDPVIRSLLEDHSGVLWIATNAYGVVRYDGERFERLTRSDGLPGDEVMALAEDRAGGVWIVTLSGVTRSAGNELEDFSARHRFLEKNVYSVVEDDQGDLWFAAYGSGVLRYSPSAPEAERFAAFGRADGLRSPSVVSLVQDDAKNLWIGTEDGIYRLDMAPYRASGARHLTYYGRRDGFRGIECVHNSVLRDSRGRLWFGTTRGATRYDPTADVASSAAPLVHLTGVRLSFESIDLARYDRGTARPDGLPGSLVLPHDQNHLTFDFVALDLKAPEQLRYRIRLKGLDREWLEIGGDRHFTYSNLPPGHYTFAVAAEGGHGHLSEPATYRFRIERPYWTTAWFRLALVTSVIAVLWSAHRLRLRSLRRREADLERQMEARTDLVLRQKAELVRKNVELESFTSGVSHDLRSPLFTLKGFLKMLERDLAAGETARIQDDLSRLNTAVDTMSRLLEALLKLSRAGRVIHERQELAFAGLAEETLRTLSGVLTERGVEVEVVDAERTVIGDRARLLQVLQNLVENSVKFLGDQPSPRVKIGSRDEDGETVFFVEDNGVGIAGADQEKVFNLFERVRTDVEGTGLGLALVKKVVETHGGRVWIESPDTGRGTRLCFTVPPPPRHEGAKHDGSL